MKEEILGYILGNVSFGFILAFYIFALLGVTLSMLLHIKKKVNKKTENKFNIKFWIKDNFTRMLTSTICIFVVIRFYSELPIEYELNMFLGFMVGATLDRVIIFIRNKTTLSIFQQKTQK